MVLADVAPTCTCGVVMSIRSSKGYYSCENCDRLQPRELQVDPVTGENYKRRITDRDRVFRSEWTKRIARMFNSR